MPTRRLSDRIRELCGKALAARNSELDPIFSDLQSALHEHNERLRKIAAEQLSNPARKRIERRERRSA